LNFLDKPFWRLSLFSFAFASRLLKNSPFVAAFEIEAEMFSKREGEEKQGGVLDRERASDQTQQPGFLQQA